MLCVRTECVLKEMKREREEIKKGKERGGRRREQTKREEYGFIPLFARVKKGLFNSNLCNIEKKGNPTILSHASNGNDNHGKVLTFSYQGFYPGWVAYTCIFIPLQRYTQTHTPLKSAR